MTRINSAIPVRALTDEHLLAEHREIKRLPYCLQRAITSGSINKIPEKFTLGRGHVLFFLDKMQFVFNRYQEIHAECHRRGFTVIDYSDNWTNCKNTSYWNDYSSTEEERTLLQERIIVRINDSSKITWHYMGEKISKASAVEMLCR